MQEPSFGYKDYYEHFLQEDKSSFQSGKVFEEIYRRKDQDTMLRAAYDVAEKKGIPIFETTKIWEDFKKNHDSGNVGPDTRKSDKEIAQILGCSIMPGKQIKATRGPDPDHAAEVSYDEVIKEVNEYDKSTFDSTAPYDLIVSMSDKTTRERLKAAMRARAKKVGFSVRSFDDICKARFADQKHQDDEKAEREKSAQRDEAIQEAGGYDLSLGGLISFFGGQPLDYGEYICSKQGVSYFCMGRLVKVCSHPIFPTRRSINIETGSEMIDVSYRIDNQWKTAKLIDRKTISQSRLIPVLSEYGMDITSENTKEVVKYLAAMDSLNRSIIPKCETVSRLGWIQDRGFSPYIPDVSYDSGGKFSDIYSAIHEKGSFDEWKRLAGMIMEDKKYIAARIILAASVASVLLPWTSNQPFIVEHWSPESGTGKTVASMLGVSVWADPTNGRFMRPMNSTLTGFEQTASFCNNMPLFLDERQSLSPNVDPEKLIYMLCEGSGKQRGKKDGGLREQTQWLNIIIVNGEQPLSTSSKSGAVNRVISIESHGQVIPGIMTDFANALQENYGFAGRKIIERIQANQDCLQTVKDLYKKTSGDLMRDVTSKQANYGAALLVGDRFLDKIVFDGKYRENLLTKDDILPFLATPETIDINIKIRNWLRGFVVSEDQHFYHKGKIPADIDMRTTLYGEKRQDGSVLIIHEVLRDEMARRNWDLGSFMRWCSARDFIKTKYSKSSRHWDVGESIAEVGHTRVIYFTKFMFMDDEYYQNMLSI